MDKSSILNKYPAVICAADGTIALFNEMAEKSLSLLSKNGICDLMSVADALRYDIVMNSTKPRPFKTAAAIPLGYDHINIIPMDMGDMRICVAVFHTSRDEDQAVHNLSFSELGDFVNGIAGCEILRKYSSPIFPVLDLVDATKRIYGDLSERGICDLEGDFSDFDIADDMIPGEMGLQNYIYLITAALSALNDMAGRKKVRFGIEGSRHSYMINMTVSMGGSVFGFGSAASEAISASCRAKLALCELIANNNSLGFEVRFNGDEIRMILSNLSVTLDHDFKSHYRYEGYADMLTRAIAVLETVESVYLYTQQKT